jgi:predicted nucleic acid-binding protein
VRRIFADAYYWIALLNDRDQGHAAARAIGEALRGATLVTAEEILAEVLGFFAGRGRHLRHAASALVECILGDPAIVVRPQSHAGFLRGLALYGARPDKEYSLTDCVSMLAMRQEGLTEVLTRDQHFAQEGFILLL